MRVKITKGGIFGATGEIPVGTEFDVESEPTGWAGRYEVISGSTKEKTPVTNPAKAPYEAKHRGGGSYSVLDAEGNEVIEKLTKEEAEAFNALDEAGKQKAVDEKAAA